jgi:hypothetical protein
MLRRVEPRIALDPRRVEDFRSNPIGTFFDPEKVYQAYASGQSFKVLQPAIRAGKFLPDSIPSIGLPISVNTGPQEAIAQDAI